MNILHHHNLMDRLCRALVASKSWDYCVVWKLSDDQRFIEWADCCCGGAAVQDREHYGETIHDHHHHHHQYPVNAGLSCRDMMFQHPRTKSCDLLALLPCSIPLNTSGIHAQVLLSNQLSWMQFSNVLDSDVSEESLGTKVLVPVPGGLLELFVAKQVPEDEGVIDFILNYTQCGSNVMSAVVLEQEAAGLNRPVIHSSSVEETTNNINNSNNNNDNFTAIMGSPLYDEENNTNDYVMDEMKQYMRKEMTTVEAAAGYVNNAVVLQVNDIDDDDDDDVDEKGAAGMMMMMGGTDDDQNKVVMKKEMNGGGGGRGGDSVSDCSDLNMEELEDDDQTGRYRRGSAGGNGGKGPSSKNLVAERKRRKKLNDRLYKLRSLVPNISKLDRASILGDAIEFVRELENQVKELQDELADQQSDDDDDEAGTKNSCVTSTLVDPPPDHHHHLLHHNNYDNNNNNNNNNIVNISINHVSKQNPDSTESTNDKTQQMEPQVEVAQIDGKEFFVKVFSEHKAGGFLRLMEVLDTLGLEVTNANVTSFRGLVSNVFKVEKKDSDILVQTEYVRDTLLEVTRNPNSMMSSRRWVEMMKCTPSETNDHHGGHVSAAAAGDCRHLHHDIDAHHFHDNHPQLITAPTHHLHHFHT